MATATTTAAIIETVIAKAASACAQNSGTEDLKILQTSGVELRYLRT
jgi:hypothetical protein